MIICKNCPVAYECKHEQGMYNSCVKSIINGNQGQVKFGGKTFNVFDVAEDNNCEGCYFKENFPYYGNRCPYPAVLLCDDNRILMEDV